MSCSRFLCGERGAQSAGSFSAMPLSLLHVSLTPRSSPLATGTHTLVLMFEKMQILLFKIFFLRASAILLIY